MKLNKADSDRYGFKTSEKTSAGHHHNPNFKPSSQVSFENDEQIIYCQNDFMDIGKKYQDRGMKSNT